MTIKNDYNAQASSLGIPTESKSPNKRNSIKKKKKKQDVEAKLQFPLLRNDDTLDNMLKEMTGNDVQVYGLEKSHSTIPTAKEIKKPRVDVNDTAGKIRKEKQRLESMDKVNLFDSNQKSQKSPFLNSTLKRNYKTQASVEQK